jgi:hypothetical protein
MHAGEHAVDSQVGNRPGLLLSYLHSVDLD